MRQARNALLAAYHILDDDGLEGLSRDQLVGVLTTEAGIGIDTEKVKQNLLPLKKSSEISSEFSWNPTVHGKSLSPLRLSVGHLVENYLAFFFFGGSRLFGV